MAADLRSATQKCGKRWSVVLGSPLLPFQLLLLLLPRLHPASAASCSCICRVFRTPRRGCRTRRGPIWLAGGQSHWRRSRCHLIFDLRDDCSPRPQHCCSHSATDNSPHWLTASYRRPSEVAFWSNSVRRAAWWAPQYLTWHPGASPAPRAWKDLGNSRATPDCWATPRSCAAG